MHLFKLTFKCSLKHFNSKKIKMMKSIFTKPKVVKYDDLNKPWYVYFRYSGKLFRFKYGINYIKNRKKRELEANALCKALHQKLLDGWNPLIPELQSFDANMNLIDGLTFAMEKKRETLAPRTNVSYTSAYNFFISSAKKLHMGHIPINDFKRVHVKTVFEQIKKDRNWSNKSYNKNLGYIKAIFSELIQWDKIENNPAHQIKTLKTEETNANQVATDEQIGLIKNHLLEVFPHFYYYIVTIFHTGIRPNEILSLTVGMVNLEKNEIRIPASQTKTGIDRIVPINPFMESYLSEIITKETPLDYYLFGSKREFSNRGLKKDLDFIPGPNRLTRDCASKLWRKLVKTQLGIDVNMYSLKHLGADKKILAGIELDTLRELYGHTSKLMTMRYAKVVKEVYRKQIIENSPDF